MRLFDVLVGWRLDVVEWMSNFGGAVVKAGLVFAIGWLLSRPNPTRGTPMAEKEWRKAAWAITLMVSGALALASIAMGLLYLMRWMGGSLGGVVEIGLAAVLWVGVLGMLLWSLLRYVQAAWKWPELTPCEREKDFLTPVLLVGVVLATLAAAATGWIDFVFGLAMTSILWGLVKWLDDAEARKYLMGLFFVEMGLSVVPLLLFVGAFLGPRGSVAFWVGPLVGNLLLLVFFGRTVARIMGAMKEGSKGAEVVG